MLKAAVLHHQAKAAAKKAAVLAALHAEHAALVSNGHAADANEVYGAALGLA
jgi:hypothetical protein